jgi:hypothetical protein
MEQALKLGSHLRFPNSLFGVFSHAEGIPRCERCIFVIEATQLPKQKQPLPVR